MARPDEEEPESVAIVLADPFELGKQFGPLVAGNNAPDEEEQSDPSTQPESALPWCLMRVCNVPLIGLALDALQSAKMDKVYVYANHGFNQIQQYLSKLDSNYSFQLILKQTGSVTEGDVLREADALELKTNFVLLRAGYIGNLDLQRALKEFANKRKRDANLVLDSLLMPAAVATSTNLAQFPTYAVTSTTRMAHFQPPSDTAKRVKIPREIIEEGLLHAPDGGLEIRGDLSSVGVDICSPEVCPLFSENFDWMNLRTHFVVGVLTSDLLGKTISCTIVGESHAMAGKFGRMVESSMFINSPDMFIQANLAFLRRRFYPLAPDEYLPAPAERLSARGNVYLGRKVEMARTSALHLALVEGNGSLKANSSVSHSCLGSKCTVGARSTVTRSIWGHNCSIAEDCTIEDCVIGDGASVSKGSVLRKCLVGPKVALGEGTAVEEGWISCEPRRGAEEDEEEEEETEQDSQASSEMLGPNSHAYMWPEEDDDEEDDSASETSDLADRLDSTHLHDNDSCSSLSITRTDSMDSLSTLDSNVSLQLDKDPTAPDVSAFDAEIQQSLERAFTEDHTVDNLVIELKTMRMSSNVSITTVRTGFLNYLVTRIPPHKGSESLKERYAHIGPLLERWGAVLTTLAPLEEAEQVEVILSLQQLSDARDFALWLRALYEEDIIEEDSVVGWWKDPKSREHEDLRNAREKAGPFVKALLEASSDEEDSSEEEE